MKLLSLLSGPLDARDRDILNQVLRAQWWINPLLNPECGKVEPEPKYVRMVAYANGTDWNPGGNGVVGYYRWTGTAWVYVG